MSNVEPTINCENCRKLCSDDEPTVLTEDGVWLCAECAAALPPEMEGEQDES